MQQNMLAKAHLEARHVEQQVRVVPGVHADKAVVPVKGGEGTGQAVLHVPEYLQVAIMLSAHEL